MKFWISKFSTRLFKILMKWWNISYPLFLDHFSFQKVSAKNEFSIASRKYYYDLVFVPNDSCSRVLHTKVRHIEKYLYRLSTIIFSVLILLSQSSISHKNICQSLWLKITEATDLLGIDSIFILTSSSKLGEYSIYELSLQTLAFDE